MSGQPYVVPADGFSFARIVLEGAAASQYGTFVTVQPESFYNACRCLVAVRSGVVRAAAAVTPKGELVSVVRLPDGNSGDVAAVIHAAIRAGATWLECFDGKLPRLYRDYGFREVDRARWCDDYAPFTWNYARDGRPDYLTLSLVGAS